MKRIPLIFIIVFISVPAVFSQQIIRTNLQELDQERINVQSMPTDENNCTQRLNMLDSWTRLLTFAGADIGGYLTYRNAIRNNQASKYELHKAVDSAFFYLERFYADFKISPAGKEFKPRQNYIADNYQEWHLMRGDMHNTGYTSDPGPSKGILAWKFPSGRPWYSRPNAQDGKVYVVSPGMTTILYCLSEKDGSVIWKAVQRGNGHQYGTARMNSSVVILKDYCVVREVGSGGNQGHQKHLVYVDKKSGAVIKEEVAGHVDYRVGYAPLEGNEDYMVYPHGVQTIHWAKERTITTFDSIICRSSITDEVLWKHYIGEYWTEPKLDNGQVFIGTANGEVICLNASKDLKRIAWIFKAESAVNAKINVNSTVVVSGSEDGTIYGINRKTGNQIWKFKIDDPEKRAFQQFSMAEIFNDKIFIGAADNYLYCLDINSGKLIWKKNLGDWIRSKPVVTDEFVFAVTLAGRLYKFNIDGDLQWIKQPTGHQVFADIVSGNGNILINSSDLYLHCIDTESGLEKWRHCLMEAVYTQNDRIWADIDGGGGDFQSPPVVADGMVITAGPDHFVHALDHETGKEIWRYEIRGQIPAAPIYFEGNIYFGQQGGTSYYYCISAGAGDLVWKKKLGWGWASANAVDGKIYIPTVSGWIYCLDAKTGLTIWEYNTENGTYPAPAIEENVVVFGSWNGKYYGFNKTTGEMLWVFDIQGNPDSGASLVKNGKAYLQGLGAKFFYCVDLHTGKEIWKFPIPAGYECNMSPSLHDNKVFFSVFRNGEVCSSLVPGITYCVNASTGEKIWELDAGGGLSGIAVADGKVYFASTLDPFIWCVGEDGNNDGSTNIYWKFKMNGRAEESCVAVAYGKAYILSTDGYVYAIE